MADTTTYLDATNGNAEIDLDPNAAKTKWLLEEGYLTLPKPLKKDQDRGREATSVPAKEDPTLAINREDPVPPHKLAPHIANPDSAGEPVTTHGRDMGLDAKPVGNVDQAPKVKVTPHKDAGTDA